MKLTYGLELEAVDFDRSKLILPDGCLYSAKEVTLVNSDGTAVDTTFKTRTTIGGEINTTPTYSIRDQVRLAEKCFNLLREHGATINYRCNTQSHVGGWDDGDEHDTLIKLQKIQSYCYKNYDRMLMLTMGPGQFTKKPEYPRAFWSHYRERMVPQWRHNFIVTAKTLEECRDAYCYTKDRTFIQRTFVRQGINTHSYFKTKSIEFRIFWATLDANLVSNILFFSTVIIEDALGKQDSFGDIEKYFKGRFPQEIPYDPELEKGFQATRVEKPASNAKRYWPKN